jgi:hypothetical protein
MNVKKTKSGKVVAGEVVLTRGERGWTATNERGQVVRTSATLREAIAWANRQDGDGKCGR